MGIFEKCIFKCRGISLIQKIVKKSRSKSKINNKDNSRLAWIWRTIVFILVATTIFLVIVDVFVYKKFTGKKWSLPSHVYSRPLELYQGLSLSRQLLEWELQELGYKKVDAAKAPGQFSVSEQSWNFSLVVLSFGMKESPPN